MKLEWEMIGFVMKPEANENCNVVLRKGGIYMLLVDSLAWVQSNWALASKK